MDGARAPFLCRHYSTTATGSGPGSGPTAIRPPAVGGVSRLHRLDYAALTTPRSDGTPKNSNTARPARLAESSRLGPLLSAPGTGPHRPTPTLPPSVRLRGRHTIAIAPPARCPGRKELHWFRDASAPVCSSRQPSRQPSSSALPRRHRPPPRRPRRRPSRSSGSPGPSWAITGATARPAPGPSTAPAWSSTPTGRRATGTSSGPAGCAVRGRSTATSRPVARPAGRTPDR